MQKTSKAEPASNTSQDVFACDQVRSIAEVVAGDPELMVAPFRRVVELNAGAVWEETMKMHLVALAGLAIGSTVFSGCTNTIPPQNTLPKPNARDQRDPYPSYFFNSSKPSKDHPGQPYPTTEVIG